MSGIKKLASQTIWYGASSIAARFINYLLTPLLTYTINPDDFGNMGLVYSIIPILNVIFTYGFETAYFRFSTKEEHKKSIYNTAALSLIFTTVLFTAILWLSQRSLGSLTLMSEFPGIIQMSIFIIALDALTTIPFARLREQGRPRKFAFIKITGIVINVFFTWFFVRYCPKQMSTSQNSWVSVFFDSKLNPVYYVILANLLQSGFTLLLLRRELSEITFKFDFKLWKRMMIYSLPLIIAGMGGMINETFDRLMLGWWLPLAEEERKSQIGIYNACYKLSILITLFIQAFRLGAEPFFFKHAEGANPQRIYARVMKFFVIVVTTMFLVVALFLPIWKHFIGPKYWAGLAVVPILLWANIFLGIYYNLSIWYKVSHRTMAGAWITIIGATITFLINYFLIPTNSYMACAWATFACYGSMMLLSFLWGQKVYRIPYAWKKLLAYMVITALLYFLHETITGIWKNKWIDVGSASFLLLAFILFVGLVERKELPKLPFIGKIFAAHG